MLRIKLLVLFVLMVTPLLVSPLALRQEAPRGLASVGVVNFPQGFAAMGAFSQVDVPSLLKSDSEFRSTFNYFHQMFGQASVGYLEGLQRARGAYGLKGTVFSEPQPIPFRAFELNAPFGVFGSAGGMWGNFDGLGQIVDGNGGGTLVKPNAPAVQVPQRQVRNEVVRIPLGVSTGPQARFGTAK